MLIQKSIKQAQNLPRYRQKFESFVNSEEYQTVRLSFLLNATFESFVNSEEYQTGQVREFVVDKFESFVNSEEYQTTNEYSIIRTTV